MKKKKKLNFNFYKLFFGLFILGSMLMLFALILFKIYILAFKDDVMDLNMEASRLSLTSSVYTNDRDGNPKEYSFIFGTENRVWVNFDKIPKYMKDAIIAIEDKRFYKHGGIDFLRTSGAVFNTLLRKHSHGGSTLTQQLIKNITEDSEVSMSRKVREMARAIRLEENYSKDEILEVYLNVVNFGAGSRGAQAAAKIYFGKDIWECSVAQCAAIAAITQNPSNNNPLANEENNKRRRNIVIKEMFAQKKITEQEYEDALNESEKMQFKKSSSDKFYKPKNNIKNWYIESMCKEIIKDLMEKYRIKKGIAEDILYSGGLKIYSYMDENAQKFAEETIKDPKVMPNDSKLELGFMMTSYDGQILAMLGSSRPKDANLIYDRCNAARRQPGSIIKPIAVYALALDLGAYNFSSKIPDKPLQLETNESGETKNWPENWYKDYKGEVTLQWAIEKSANAPAAQILSKLGTHRSFAFLTQKLGVNGLDLSDASSLSALAAGGTHIGVTVKEMAGAFQIFGNGGRFFKLRTYSHVTDKNGKVILDNRKKDIIQATSEESANIMNRLLKQVICGSEGTGRKANIENWDIVGKTGTTNDDYDTWFVGLSPRALGCIWLGYDSPKRIKETGAAIRIWKSIMSRYLSNYEPMEFVFSDNLIKSFYCPETGFLANSECPDVAIGYYSRTNLPPCCSLHGGNNLDIITVDEERNKNNKETLEGSVSVEE